METRRFDVPAGAFTAAPIAPPVASVAVVPGARIECPIRLVPFMMEEACIEACMLCMADTWLMPSNCVTNWVGSVGVCGFCFFFCVVFCCCFFVWLFCLLVGVLLCLVVGMFELVPVTLWVVVIRYLRYRA